MATPFEMTADGYEAQIQTNYLSHWVLTYHLLPLLRKTAATSTRGEVRIVNVSSMGHKQAPSEGINFKDINLKDSFTFSRYAQSKLANVLHAKALNKHFGTQSQKAGAEGEMGVASLHPGNVDTQLNAKSWGVQWYRFYAVSALISSRNRALSHLCMPQRVLNSLQRTLESTSYPSRRRAKPARRRTIQNWRKSYGLGRRVR
jgi:NAD(P)-dependent dehydrogenase (short-subunit alcohol dehydrogenase family)